MTGTVTGPLATGRERTPGLLAALPHANPWLGFLADDEWVARRGREPVATARARLSAPADPAALMAECNLLALKLFRRRRLEEARRICRGQIGFARRQRDRSLLYYALQPQINLLRLEGFTGDVDAALRGLAALEPLAAGGPARLPELEIDAAALQVIRDAGFHPEALARAVRVVDTCKILWRRGRPARLLTEADRMLARWPFLADGTEPHHAAEATWLVKPLAHAAGAIGAPRGRHSRAARLRYVNALHLASESAHRGLPYAGPLAHELYQNRTSLSGDFRSALTPARCLAALGDTLLRTGQPAEAAVVLRESIAIAGGFGDDALVQELWARLVLADPDAPPGPAVDTSGAPADEELMQLMSLALAQLGSG